MFVAHVPDDWVSFCFVARLPTQPIASFHGDADLLKAGKLVLMCLFLSLF